MKVIKILVLVIVLGMILGGCGKTAGKLEVKPKAVTLTSAGGKSTLAVNVYDTEGNPITDNKQPIAWTTSNPNVATVVDGKVTSVGSGKAVVTASLGDLKATASVTVSIIAKISLSPGSMKLSKGDKGKFKAIVKNEKGGIISDAKITWSSKASNVASVNNSGGVLAKAKGKTSIRAVVADKAAAATVEVIDPEKDKDSKVGGIKVKGKGKGKGNKPSKIKGMKVKNK